MKRFALLNMVATVALLVSLPAMAETTITTTTKTTTITPASPVPVTPVVVEPTHSSTTITTTEPVMAAPVVTTTGGVVTTTTTPMIVNPSAPVVVAPGTVVTSPAVIPVVAGVRTIHFEDFDINHDAMLARWEAGEMLFKLYDMDGNMVIDNIEFEKKAVLTVTPMQAVTRMSYDFDNDGIADKTVVTVDDFMQRSMLSRFDRNGDGLSAHEFTGEHFNEVDINNDHAVDKKEWIGSYDAQIDAKNRAEAALNK
jgi:hypothetical protein